MQWNGQTIRKLALAAAIGGSLAGCKTNNGPSIFHDSSGGRGAKDETDILAYDRNNIPKGAKLVAEGLDKRSFKADSDGSVYLWDDDRRTVLDARQLKKGEHYEIDPLNARATIDDNPITLNRPMLPRNIHRIYFLAASH
jgi:hypothetical protein